MFGIYAGKPGGQILHSPKSYIENLLPVKQIAAPQNESAWRLDVRVCSENSLALEDTIEVCREKGVSAPDTLVVVGDNTVKELKNKVCLSGVANFINHSHLKHLDANVKQKVLNFFPTLI